MSQNQPANANQGVGVLAAIEDAWNAAAKQWNPDALTAIYTRNALFFGGRPDLYVGERRIHEYFSSYDGVIRSAVMKFRDQQVLRFGPDRFLAQGFCDFSFVLAGNQNTTSVLRTTLVLTKGDDGWKIEQYHAAPAPSAPPLGEGDTSSREEGLATIPGQDTSPHAAVEALQRLMSERFTCRAYRPDPVPEGVIRDIVNIARQTASWCNVQPWHVTIATSATMDAFRDALVEQARRNGEVDSDLPFPEEYWGVYADRRRETGYRLYDALGIERGDKERRANQGFENFRMFGAPHVAIVTVPAKLGPYAGVDCGGFINSFLLAARAHGVATTPQAAIARHAKFVRRFFEIGDERQMVCAISFGYADAEHPVNQFRTSRASVDEVMDIV